MENEKNRITVETADEDGKKLELAIKPLGHKILQDAQMAYNVKLTSLIRQSVSGGNRLLSRQQLDQHLSELGIWTERDAKQFLQLQLELRSLELEIQKGGIKVSELRKIGLRIKVKRAMLLALYNQRSQFDAITMESMADNQKFKFLMVKCIVFNGGDTPFLIDIDDYDTRQGEQAVVDAATALAGHLYGYDQGQEADLIENRLLRQFDFVDDTGRLINDDGKLVDVAGRLIDENGRFVNGKGEFVDDQNRLVDKDGDFVVKTKPFIDDRAKRRQTTKKRKKRKTQK